MILYFLYVHKRFFSLKKLPDQFFISQTLGGNINLTRVNSFIIKIEVIKKVIIDETFALQLQIIK